MFNILIFIQMKNLENLVALNSVLNEFAVEELEQRLETDPLAVGGLINLTTSGNPLLSARISDCEFCDGDVTCNIHP